MFVHRVGQLCPTPGSDRLIDALVWHGDAAAAAIGVRAHLDAGAGHVGVTALGADPMSALRALAESFRS